MEYFLVSVGIDVRCDRDIGVAHKLLGHVDGDAGPLKVGAERVAETIGCEVRGNGVLGDLPVSDFCPHVEIQVMGKGIPKPAETVGAADTAVGRGKDGSIRCLAGLQKAISELLAHGDIPDPGGGFRDLDGPRATFYGLVYVDFIALKVNVFPEKRSGLPGAQASVEDCQHPQPRRVGLGYRQDVFSLLFGNGPMAPLYAFWKKEAFGGIVDDEPGPAGPAGKAPASPSAASTRENRTCPPGCLGWSAGGDPGRPSASISPRQGGYSRWYFLS